MSDILDTELDIVSTESTESGEPELIEVIQLPAGEVDPRIKLLSHSSRELVHKCPRKFQLYRLNSRQAEGQDIIKGIEKGVTFSYGTAVGNGIQSAIAGNTEEQVIIDTFLGWDSADLLEENKRQNKSFWKAMFAVQKFIQLRDHGLLKDYELVYYNGKPAVEMSFNIILPNGFYYRGFVDVVLRHKETGEIMVLELKTSSGTANPAMFKNSGQALGYSVVLDIIFPEMSAYTVLYLVYETKSYDFKQLAFTKSLLQRALWLQELLIDTKVISMYEEYETYPQHGSACFDFFTDCEFLGLCTMDTARLTKPYDTADRDRIEKELEEYDFTISFDDLVQAQINKAEL